MAALTLLFLAGATVVNIGTSTSVNSHGMTAGLAALSLLVLGGAFGGLSGLGPSGWPAFFIWASSLGFLGSLVPLFFAGQSGSAPLDLSFVVDDLSYSEMQVTVGAGELLVGLSNQDLFWHTLTIDEIDFDLVVPARGRVSVELQIPPGTYQFFCRVPGNRWAGMRGTLVAES